ncbi:tetratricopeptide repeat protein [Streptomyces collinus]|uniref:Uncharacterized protein n=2 Tax=Streptomyces collinus TaxID=42684 RepID=S5VAF2_STRC3|nr:tetratricopeptide repeat protein [Streptomyces collinus]AGS72099.1 hypothetical protein B446_26455 [Streptomyces collinus Tu 365]
MLTSQGEGSITQSGAVHGLGGVGKTALALHYAHHHIHLGDYSLVWWIDAMSPNSIEQSLATLAERLVPGWAAGAESASRVAWALQWLTWHPGWLLVYDNVENPRDLSPYTGALHGGHHLATSRRTTGWPDHAPTLALGILGADDATNLLCRLAFKGGSTTARERADAAVLAAELGFLPLALKQAGAYLCQNRGISIDAYRRRLQTNMREAADGIDAERTVARVWHVTLDALRKADPLAVSLLEVAAWLAPENIPHSLLTPSDSPPHQIAKAIGTLAAYSMVTDSGTTVTLHRLVQTVLRTATPRHWWSKAWRRRLPRGRAQAERALLRALSSPTSQETADEIRWDSLTPHLVALAATTPAGHPAAIPLVNAYSIAAHRLHQQSHTARAIPLLLTIVAQRKQSLGDTHPHTLTSRNDLALAYQDAGDLDRAIPLLQTTLAQRERTLGDAASDTLTSRNDLALAYQDAGDLDRAIPLLQTTLAEREHSLGNAHPDVLTSRNNLALAYQDAGDLDRAIPLLQIVLAQREHSLGNAHPHALASRNDLALAYQDSGDLDRAIPLLQTTLAERERILGDTHPHALASRNDLALAYQDAGDLDRAIPLLQTTLAERERILGDTHPHALTSRNNLALAYQDAGHLDRAIPLLQTTLAERERILGDTHPHTLTSRNNLALAYQDAGHLDRAIPLYQAALTQREQVLGDAHPDTVASRNNLASAVKLRLCGNQRQEPQQPA